MTEYTDIERVNRLLAEQKQIQKATDILNDTGTVSAVIVAPTEASEYSEETPTQAATANASQDMIDAVKSGLNNRYNEINQELRDLGVTGVPADSTGVPPVKETEDNSEEWRNQ